MKKRYEKPVDNPAAHSEKPESESVKGLRIILDALKKSGRGPGDETYEKIYAMIAKG